MISTLLLASLAHASDPGAILAEELERVSSVLAEQEVTPHYISLVVEDFHVVELRARSGTISTDGDDRARFLDVDLRVGTPELDSTHQLRGLSAWDDDNRRRVRVPFTGSGVDDALRSAVWREVDGRYRDARERIVLIEAERAVRVAEENPADDFTPATPVVDAVQVPELAIDDDAWRELLVDLSARIDASPDVHRSGVRLSAERSVWHFVDSEGSRITHGRVHARLSMQAGTVAEDGDEVQVFRALDVHDASSLPGPAELQALADEVAQELEALRDAPRGEPYTGPVLLEGKASGVFVHEVIGHRVEGHRQKDDGEGKTFLEYVGRSVLPSFISIRDDPTVSHLAGHDLNGFYRYDDEGVAAAPAALVDDGRFVGFLMGRSPIDGFAGSNGHGRRSSGRAPTSRMGNTIMEAEGGLSAEALRTRLLREVKKQGLEYGYVVEEIDGGFTMTGRVAPNAFNVRASKSWRVYADGRPDELIRGIDLVGTPLVAFRSILAAGDTREVFNGMCGAESGWVPVSAVAPALLFQRLEFQLKEKASSRPPLLVKPRERLDATAALGGEQ